jgi:hypothetical protein
VKDNEILLNRSGMTQLPGFYRIPYFKVCISVFTCSFSYVLNLNSEVLERKKN